MNETLIECVPNFSEGRDASVIEKLIAAIDFLPGILILDRTSDWDHHRTVLTFAGPRGVMAEAGVRLASAAAASIDLNRHQGVHPRVGALDVLPFVPLGSTTLDNCAALARETGERISRELRIPVYFYGGAAMRPERTALENVRRGQFEGLRESVVRDAASAPDLGGPALHPTAGAVIVGARKILIAFNINLRTSDIEAAKSIARRIRASGGGFPAVKALGLRLRSRQLVQVSMNLVDYEKTSLQEVYAAVEQLTAEQGIAIEGSELIGLLPRAALCGQLPPLLSADHTIEARIDAGTRARGLRTLAFDGPYLAGEKIC